MPNDASGDLLVRTMPGDLCVRYPTATGTLDMRCPVVNDTNFNLEYAQTAYGDLKNYGPDSATVAGQTCWLAYNFAGGACSDVAVASLPAGGSVDMNVPVSGFTSAGIWDYRYFRFWTMCIHCPTPPKSQIEAAGVAVRINTP